MQTSKDQEIRIQGLMALAFLMTGPCVQKHTDIYSTLERIARAEPRSLDIWSVSFTASAHLLCWTL